MSFNITMSPELGIALVQWDERMHEVWQTLNHSRLMIEPLGAMGLKKRAKDAGEIYRDIKHQLKSGALVARMMESHATMHPVLRNQVESEVFRQFNNVLYPLLFATLDEQREQELSMLVDGFLVVASEAVFVSEGAE